MNLTTKQKQKQNNFKFMCPHCNTLWKNHLGVTGTCKKLQTYKNIVDSLYDQFTLSRTSESDSLIIAKFMEKCENFIDKSPKMVF